MLDARPLTSEEKRALMLLKFRPVCICNTIRVPRVREAIDRGARTVEDVAKATGCTTGTCQGERCRPVIEAMLAEAGAADGPRVRGGSS